MATVINRSRFRLTVARRTDLARTFPYDAELRGQGLAPRLARLDDRFEVKIHQKKPGPTSASPWLPTRRPTSS